MSGLCGVPSRKRVITLYIRRSRHYETFLILCVSAIGMVVLVASQTAAGDSPGAVGRVASPLAGVPVPKSGAADAESGRRCDHRTKHHRQRGRHRRTSIGSMAVPVGKQPLVVLDAAKPLDGLQRPKRLVYPRRSVVVGRAISVPLSRHKRLCPATCVPLGRGETITQNLAILTTLRAISEPAQGIRSRMISTRFALLVRSPRSPVVAAPPPTRTRCWKKTT